MHINLCVLIEISKEIRMIKFWIVISESCVTVRETHFIGIIFEKFFDTNCAQGIENNIHFVQYANG